MRQQIDHVGFAVVAQLLDSTEVAALRESVVGIEMGAGVRNLLAKVPAARALATHPGVRA
jgi:hypothetical protein